MALKKLHPNIPHPAASPNLNPIEPVTVWKVLKTKIRTHPHPLTSMDELKQAWDATFNEDIHTHTKYMEDRVKAVINAQGGHTKVLESIFMYILMYLWDMLC